MRDRHRAREAASDVGSDLVSNEHNIFSSDHVQSQRLVEVLAADDFALGRVGHNDVGVLIERQQVADQLATVAQQDQHGLAQQIHQRGRHHMRQERIGLRAAGRGSGRLLGRRVLQLRLRGSVKVLLLLRVHHGRLLLMRVESLRRRPLLERRRVLLELLLRVSLLRESLGRVLHHAWRRTLGELRVRLRMREQTALLQRWLLLLHGLLRVRLRLLRVLQQWRSGRCGVLLSLHRVGVVCAAVALQSGDLAMPALLMLAHPPEVSARTQATAGEHQRTTPASDAPCHPPRPL